MELNLDQPNQSVASVTSVPPAVADQNAGGEGFKNQNGVVSLRRFSACFFTNTNNNNQGT